MILKVEREIGNVTLKQLSIGVLKDFTKRAFKFRTF